MMFLGLDRLVSISQLLFTHSIIYIFVLGNNRLPPADIKSQFTTCSSSPPIASFSNTLLLSVSVTFEIRAADWRNLHLR